jgi:hypothetical protein
VEKKKNKIGELRNGEELSRSLVERDWITRNGEDLGLSSTGRD